MTLRSRTLLIVALTLLGLFSALYVTTRSQMNRGFSTVEKKLAESFSLVENRDARKNVERAQDAFRATMNNLSTILADWAQWDDTYRYVEDSNRQYRKSNLMPQTFEALKINFFAIVNNRGRIVFSYLSGPVDRESRVIPPDLLGHLGRNAKLVSHTDPHSLVEGILLLEQGPMIVASRPIITSEGHGPLRGSVVFGYFFNDSAINQLEEVTHLSIRIHKFDGKALPADFTETKNSPAASGGELVRRLSHDTIAGFASIKDIYGNPSLILQVSLPREIHQQERATLTMVHSIGREMMVTQMLGVVAAGTGLGAAIMLILEIVVLSRLGRLSSKTVDIGARKDFSARVTVEGKDELARLGTAINGMLMSLARTHEEIQNRTAEMRLLMDSVPVALLSLDTSLRINPEYSGNAETMLGREKLSGLDFCDCLGLAAKGPQAKLYANLLDFLDLFRSEALPENDMAKLNPLPVHQMTVAGSIRWFKLDFHLIRRAPVRENHVLVIIEDCTAGKELEQEIVTTQQENLQLKAIAEDPDLFREFITEARGILENVRGLSKRLVANGKDEGALREMFRGIHSIKGIAGAFSLNRIAETAGKLENTLTLLLRKENPSAENIERAHSSIAALSGEMESLWIRTARILGTSVDDDASMSVRVALREFKDHIDTIKEMRRDLGSSNAEAAAAADKIIHRLEAIKMVPAVKALGRATKIVPDLIRRLDKNAVFTFEGQDTRIDYELAHMLNTPLVHLFRNAFDHGIEYPEKRIQANKPEQGRVTLAVRKEGGAMVLEVSDDGAGIDPDKIKAVAVSKKFIDPDSASGLSREEWYDFLFRPGFSTKKDVTDVSGRGVGLDVVYDSVKNKLNGSVRIDSEPGRGTRFTLRVPLK